MRFQQKIVRILYLVPYIYLVYIFLYIYFSRRKHALRKASYLPKPYLVSLRSLGNRYLKKKPCIQWQSCWYHWQIDHLDASFNLKNASESNASNYTPTWRTHGFSRHQCCLTLNFGDNAHHSHSDRFQRLTDREERATQRTCMASWLAVEYPKYRHTRSLTGCIHNKAYLLVMSTRSSTTIGVNVSFLLRILQRLGRYGSGGMPFSGGRVSYRSIIKYYTGNSSIAVS